MSKSRQQRRKQARERRKQQELQGESRPKNRQGQGSGSVFRSRFVSTCKILGGALTLVSVLLTALSYVPKPTVASSAALNPADPLSTPFVISNNGSLPMHDVSFRCVIRNLESESHGRFVAPAGAIPTDFVIRTMHSGESATVGCPFQWMKLTTPLAAGDIEIVVVYRPDWWPWRREKPFRFATARYSDGTLHWLPRALSE